MSLFFHHSSPSHLWPPVSPVKNGRKTEVVSHQRCHLQLPHPSTTGALIVDWDIRRYRYTVYVCYSHRKLQPQIFRFLDDISTLSVIAAVRINSRCELILQFVTSLIGYFKFRPSIAKPVVNKRWSLIGGVVNGRDYCIHALFGVRILCFSSTYHVNSYSNVVIVVPIQHHLY